MNATATDNPKGARKRRGGGRKGLLAAIVLATALVTVGVVALLVNIFQHKQEAQDTNFAVVQLDETVVDPAVWGKNFPLQYDMYKRTTDQQRTKFGGSEAVPHVPEGARYETRLDDAGVALGISVVKSTLNVTTAVLASIGYGFTSDQLFWLVALPNLVGAAMRIPYTAAKLMICRRPVMPPAWVAEERT